MHTRMQNTEASHGTARTHICCLRANVFQLLWSALLMCLLHATVQDVLCSVRTTDQYGRSVSTCSIAGGGEDLNAWLVNNGYAVAYRWVLRPQSAAQIYLNIFVRTCTDTVPPAVYCRSTACTNVWIIMKRISDTHLLLWGRQYGKEYIPLEEAAHAKHLGIWSGSFTMPADWRKKQKSDSGGSMNGGTLSSVAFGVASPATRQPLAPEAGQPTCAGGTLPLKGNIGGKGKIYHTPGSQYYDKVGLWQAAAGITCWLVIKAVPLHLWASA